MDSVSSLASKTDRDDIFSFGKKDNAAARAEPPSFLDNMQKSHTSGGGFQFLTEDAKLEYIYLSLAMQVQMI